MAKVFCTVSNEFISVLDAKTFHAIENYLVESGLASDKDTFDVIRGRLVNPPTLDADGFAEEAIYVILAGGFRQKIAKKKYGEIMEFIRGGGEVSAENLLPIFGNANKVRAIAKIWNGRQKYRDGFYAISDDARKLGYLRGLPHIGDITKNHLARNLGISNVKYDVWIQRLGIALCGGDGMEEGFPLAPKVCEACDEMFSGLERATGLNKGYIDVVLWKACQIGALSFR
jgi:hypothetical protein